MAKAKPRSTDEISAFIEEFKSQTDRGAAIVAAAALDDALAHAIQTRFVSLSNRQTESLFGRMRPLSSFSAKIELGAAIGLYDQNLRGALNMVRDVRNHFAHHIGQTGFNDPSVAKLVLSARPPMLPKDSPPRAIFDLAFLVAFMLLRAIATQPSVKVKGIGETHPHIFVDLALAAKSAVAAMASGNTKAQPPSTTGTPSQKP